MFAFDIAIIILSEPFVLYGGVQPVCIDLSNESQNMNLSSTNGGVVCFKIFRHAEIMKTCFKVTGWGNTLEEEELSDILKEQIIPIIPFNKCVNESTENFRKYITPDKICGGYGNSHIVTSTILYYNAISYSANN